MLDLNEADANRPAFALRLEGGHGRLKLTRPFPVRANDRKGDASLLGTLVELVLDLGAIRGSVRFRGGWTAVRTFHTELVSAVIDLDLEALSRAAPGPTLFVEGALAAERGMRASLREGKRVVAFDAAIRWRDDDALVVLDQVRASERRGPSALADVLDALAPSGAKLEPETGAVRIPRPVRRFLAEALLPLGMRVPVVRGLAHAPPTVHVDGRGRSILRIAVGSAAARASSLGSTPTEPPTDVHRRARLVASVTAALAEGDITAAARELERLRDRLFGEDHAALRATCALEGFVGADGIHEHAEGLLPSLARARSALASPDLTRFEHEVREWLAREPSDAFAAAALVQMAERVRPTDASRARWLARQAAARLGRISYLLGEPRENDWLRALAERAIELGEGEIPPALVEDLLPALGVRSAAGSALELAAAGLPIGDVGSLEGLAPEVVSPALPLALEALGRTELADHAWQRLRTREDAETAALVAARDERRGDRLAALESWDRAASLAEREGRLGDTRRAWVRAGRLAHALSLDEAAALRLERALDVRAPIAARDAVELVSAVRSVDAVELAGRIEQLVMAAVAADGGESPELVGALEELLGWALERGAATRARALHAALTRVRPDRAKLEELSLEPPETEDPRRRAERLRAEGKLGEAAEALAALGTTERDAATLRAALDLAERAGATQTAARIIDTLLEWVGPGPVADALARRRTRLGL